MKVNKCSNWMLSSGWLGFVSFVSLVGWALLIWFSLTISAHAQVRFENTTASLGGPFHEGESWGAAWGHLNDDVYPDLFVSNHALLNSLLRNDNGVTFTETVQSADIDGVWTSEPEGDIHGGSWADYDNDGDQDLFVTRSSQGARVHLMQNDGQGRFRERGGAAGIGGVGGGRLPMLFDYTNDGRLDIIIVGRDGNRIFRQNATNRFQEQTSQAGIANDCPISHGGLVSDFFDTGSLNYVCLSPRGTIQAAYDTGTLPFRNVANSFDRVGSTPDTVLADFNNDLKMDMFTLRGPTRPSSVARVSNRRIEAWLSVSRDQEKSMTFSATGPLTVRVSARVARRSENIRIGSSGFHPSRDTIVRLDPSNPAVAGTSNHTSFGVYIEYNPGRQEWTISVNGGGRQSEGVYFTVDGAGFSEPSVTGLTRSDDPAAPRFFLNSGSRLVNANNRGIGTLLCGSIAAADFDNDMDVDLYFTCRTGVENLENRLYLNDGSGRFSLATGSTGAEGLIGVGTDSRAGTAESAVTADYDVDGFVDLFVTNGNRIFPHPGQDGFSAGGPDQFYRNLGNSNSWLEFDLRGVASNRDGFGAKVIVTAGGVSQLREQNGGYHRWSQDHKRLHFGLANNRRANVRIEWPNGSVDTHNDVAADRLYRATQGGALVNITPTAGNPPPPPPPPPGGGNNNDDVCGKPDFTPNSDRGFFIWRDCDGSGDWRVRATAGGPTQAVYQSSLSSGNAFDSVVPFSFESNGDSFDLSNSSSQLDLMFTMINGGQDGVDFSLPDNSELCLMLEDPNQNIFVGAGLVPFTSQVNLVTLTNDCGNGGTPPPPPPPSGNNIDPCGEPTFSSRSDAGVFLWQDCGNTDNWVVRATAGGGAAINYNGSVVADSQISSLTTFSFEGRDSATLNSGNRQLDFFMRMANAGVDGMEFSLQPGSTCFDVDSAAPVVIGQDNELVTPPFDVFTFDPC